MKEEIATCRVCGYPVSFVVTRIGTVREQCMTCERNRFRKSIGLPPLTLIDERPVPPEEDLRYLRSTPRPPPKPRMREDKRRALILAALEQEPKPVRSIDLARTVGRPADMVRRDLQAMFLERLVTRTGSTYRTYRYQLRRHPHERGCGRQRRAIIVAALSAMAPLSAAELAAPACCASSTIASAIRPLLREGILERLTRPRQGKPRLGKRAFEFVYRLKVAA